MNKKRVGIWIRVSTEDSARGESPEIHKIRAQKYAELKEWNIVTIYDLSGHSGKSVMEHPEAQRMLNDIKRGAISGLIFSKIARLARNTRQLLEFADIFRTYNADLISIAENIDTSTPAGRLFYTMISAMAEWEREEIVERLNASIEVRSKLGKKLGGQAQYGFQWVGEELQLHPIEAPIRKMMYELFLKEKRLKTIAQIINNKGYRTRSGKPFNASTIKRWLQDPISMGQRRTNYCQDRKTGQSMIYKPKEEWHIHSCPAIVSKELWQEVNDLIDEQAKNRKPILNRRVHLFTSFLTCHCSGRMNVRSRLTHYSCQSENCKNKIQREDLEEAFKSRLNEFLSNKKELETYFNQSEEQSKDRQTELETLKLTHSKVKVQIENLLDLHLKGQIPTEAFSEYHEKPYQQSQQLENQIALLENELISDSERKRSTDFIINNSKDIYAQWDTYNRDKKREIIETIVESVVIGTDTIDFNIKQLNPVNDWKTEFSEFGENGAQYPTQTFG